jgi:hypothetical protein
VPPDLDALLTGLYVLADDFLPQRRGAGRRPRISDAELLCLAVAQIFLDCPKERRFLRLARQRLGHLFPYIPGQSGYNKRLRALAPQIARFIGELARLSPSFCDRLRLLDSTPVACAQSRETVKRSRLAGHAGYGYSAAHSRYFWGFRLYLLCAPDGMPIGFELASANAPEREVAAELLERALRPGQLVLADKGFAGAEFEQLVRSLDCQLLRPDRRDEQPRLGSLGGGSGSSRSCRRPRASCRSSATARARCRDSSPASHNVCSRWRRAAGTTGSSASPGGSSPPMTTELSLPRFRCHPAVPLVRWSRVSWLRLPGLWC